MKRSFILSLCLGIGLATVSAGVALFLRARNQQTYYTDGQTIKLPAENIQTRDILWQPPVALPLPINTDDQDHQAHLSGDGLTMLLARRGAGGSADLFIAIRPDAKSHQWTHAEPVPAINSIEDDLEPSLSPDGSSIYFSSNRPGGLGGYDLWMARRLGENWRPPVNLGPAINSPFNESGPAVSPDSGSLYFASDRPQAGQAGESGATQPAPIDSSAGNSNLYSALLAHGGAQSLVPIAALNTPYNDSAPAFSPAGDFLYFCSDRPNGSGGFDLYRSRRLDGRHMAPMNLGPEINTPANELDPALSLEGFGLHFSSDRVPGRSAAPSSNDYNIYYAIAREVFTETDRAQLINWAALSQVLPSLLWLIVGLLAFVFLIAFWKQGRARQLSLLTKCLLASLIAHLALMILMTFWQVTASVVHLIEDRQGRKVALVSSLAGDELHEQVRGGLTELAVQSARVQADRNRSALAVDQKPAVVDLPAEVAAPVIIDHSSIRMEAAEAPSQPPQPPADDVSLVRLDTPLASLDVASPAPFAGAHNTEPESPAASAAKQDPKSTRLHSAEAFDRTNAPAAAILLPASSDRAALDDVEATPVQGFPPREAPSSTFAAHTSSWQPPALDAPVPAIQTRVSDVPPIHKAEAKSAGLAAIAPDSTPGFSVHADPEIAALSNVALTPSQSGHEPPGSQSSLAAPSSAHDAASAPEVMVDRSLRPVPHVERLAAAVQTPSSHAVALHGHESQPRGPAAPGFTGQAQAGAGIAASAPASSTLAVLSPRSEPQDIGETHSSLAGSASPDEAPSWASLTPPEPVRAPRADFQAPAEALRTPGPMQAGWGSEATMAGPVATGLTPPVHPTAQIQSPASTTSNIVSTSPASVGAALGEAGSSLARSATPSEAPGSSLMLSEPQREPLPDLEFATSAIQTPLPGDAVSSKQEASGHPMVATGFTRHEGLPPGIQAGTGGLNVHIAPGEEDDNADNRRYSSVLVIEPDAPLSTISAPTIQKNVVELPATPAVAIPLPQQGAASVAIAAEPGLEVSTNVNARVTRFDRPVMVTAPASTGMARMLPATTTDDGKHTPSEWTATAQPHLTDDIRANYSEMELSIRPPATLETSASLLSLTLPHAADGMATIEPSTHPASTATVQAKVQAPALPKASQAMISSQVNLQPLGQSTQPASNSLAQVDHAALHECSSHFKAVGDVATATVNLSTLPAANASMSFIQDDSINGERDRTKQVEPGLGVPAAFPDTSRVHRVTLANAGIDLAPGEVELEPAAAPAYTSESSTIQRPQAAIIDRALGSFDAAILARSPIDLAPAASAGELSSDLGVPTEIAPPAPAYELRKEENRIEVVKRMGGSEATERAVALALKWLAAHQSEDGRWAAANFDRRCGQCDGVAKFNTDIASTGLALLCFLGADHTHLKDGEYRDALAGALRWLIAQQKPDGDLRGSETMYSHGIAAIAISEAYGMTRDPELLDPLTRAIDFTIRCRNRTSGGWRYEPGQVGDTSMLGWQIMALVSAKRAGIEVPDDILNSAGHWLDAVAPRSTPGLYAYQPGQRVSPAMTAEGLFVQQLLGLKRDEPRMQASARYVLENPPRWRSEPNTYYWYYATLALFQHQGRPWREWNHAITAELLANQRSSGPAAGSWDPIDNWSKIGGRIYQTAMCTLCLEVYYRYLPMYATVEIDQEPE